MSRGSSLLAGVLLVGILSSLAVALQGVDPRGIEEASSVASAKLAVETVKTSDAKKSEAAKTLGCFQGYDFKVRTANGKTQVDCAQIAQCGKVDTNTASDEKLKAGGATTKCIQALRAGKGQYDQSNCTCRVLYCFPGREKGKEVCRPLKDELKGTDNSFDPTKVAGSAGKELADDVKAGDQKAVEDIKKMGVDEATKGALDRYFRESASLADREINSAKQERESVRRALERLGCGATVAAASVANSQCDSLRTQERDLSKYIADMEAQKSRLAAAAEALKPASPQNCPGGPGCQGGTWDGNLKKLVEQPPSNRFPGNDTGNTFGNQGLGKDMGNLGKALGGGQQQRGNNRPNSGTNPQQQQQQQQCYYGQQYAVQQNAYCSGGSMYAYNSQTCQYQAVQQCPSGRCTTTAGTDQYGNQRTVCAPVTPTTSQITATLSCSKKRADVGQKVTLEYACTGSEGMTATGNGFTTTSSVGTQEVTIQKPPRGANTVTYGLICKDGAGQTKAAEPCQVQIDQPLIVLVANPKQVKKGKETTIGWVTKGMKSCVISTADPDLASWSAEQANNTTVSGSVKTPALSKDVEFIVKCKTQGDQDKESKIIAHVVPE